MWRMHLEWMQRFEWKSPLCTKLVCRKHEGIPLHYKNITKHEKAKTGVYRSKFLEKSSIFTLPSLKKIGGL